MILKRKLIFKLFYILSYVLITALFSVGNYYFYLFSKYIFFPMPLVLNIHEIHFIPVVLSIIVAAIMTFIIAELVLNKNLMFLSVNENKVNIKSLLKKEEFNIEECKIIKTGFFFGIKNIYFIVKNNSIKKRYAINRFEYKNFDELSRYFQYISD